METTIWTVRASQAADVPAYGHASLALTAPVCAGTAPTGNGASPQQGMRLSVATVIAGTTSGLATGVGGTDVTRPDAFGGKAPRPRDPRPV